MSECGIEISVRKIKAVAFRGEEPGRCKIVLDDKTGTGRKFELFGLWCFIVYYEKYVNNLERDVAVCGTFKRTIGKREGERNGILLSHGGPNIDAWKWNMDIEKEKLKV